MHGPAFITMGTGGDLVIVAGRGHYLLTHEAVQELPFTERDIPLLLPGRVRDDQSSVIPFPHVQVVFFHLRGQTFFARWSDVTEVARGIVQYAPLTPLPRREAP